MASIKLCQSGKYSARVRTKGFPTVCKTFHSLRDAQAWCKRIESDQQAGRWKPECFDQLTLAQALGRYMQEVTPAKKGAKQEANLLRLILRHPATALPIERIKGSDIAKLRDGWARSGLAAATIRQRLAILSHVFTIAAQEWGQDVSNPVAQVRKPTVRNARDRRLIAGELDDILATSGSSFLAPVARLAVATAMRLGELVSLQWSDVSLSAKTAALRDTKSGKPRVVPLSHEAVQVLASLPRRIDGRVFGASSNAVTQAWRDAVRLARRHYLDTCRTEGRTADDSYLVGLRFHDLRHEAVSRLFELGTLTVPEIMSISGHRTPQMLMRYAHAQASSVAQKLG